MSRRPRTLVRMNVRDVLKAAWEAVEASGVPEHLHDTAFKAALEHLGGDVDGADGTPPSRRSKQQWLPSDRAKQHDGRGGEDFFARLARDTGVQEDDLRHVFLIEDDDGVELLPSARELGATNSDRMRTITALIGGARVGGFGENPVSAKAVRDVCKAKNCLDRNFSKRVGEMRGFRVAGGARIAPTPKWRDDFADAMKRVLGSGGD